MDYGQHILHVQFSTMHAAGGYHEIVLMKWDIDFVFKPWFQAPEAFCFLHALPVCEIRVQLRLPRWPPTLPNILIKLPEYSWLCIKLL